MRRQTGTYGGAFIIGIYTGSAKKQKSGNHSKPNYSFTVRTFTIVMHLLATWCISSPLDGIFDWKRTRYVENIGCT